MNITQAKKLAKNLRKAWPALLAEHGSELALHDAQDVIARIQGYPDWRALHQAATKHGSDGPARSDGRLESNLAFGQVGPPEPLATRYNDRTDEWTHHIVGIEVVLRPLSEHAGSLVSEVDAALYADMERAGCWSGEYPSDRSVLLHLVERAKLALGRCPFCVEAINVHAGLLYSLGAYDEAMAVAEPAATALLAMVPTDHKLVHVPYGCLENRPFYRLCHVYLLLLHRARRDKEANALAKRMHRYCPSDNMGFREMTTVADRDAAFGD